MLDLIDKHKTNTPWNNQEELQAIFNTLKLSDQQIEEIGTKRQLSEEVEQTIKGFYYTYPWLKLGPRAAGEYVVIRCTVTLALQPHFRAIRKRLEEEGIL